MPHDGGTGRSGAVTEDIVYGTARSHDLDALEALYRERHTATVRRLEEGPIVAVIDFGDDLRHEVIVVVPGEVGL